MFAQKHDAASKSTTERQVSTQPRNWLVGLTSLFFILLQSACTAVMAISGVRVVIGLSALAAAAGLNRPATGFHADAIRIPMMAIALIGSFVNLYVIWRIRSLRSRPSSQWRVSSRNCKTETLRSNPDRACRDHPCARGSGVDHASHRAQRALVATNLRYSARSARIGSMDAARHAGINDAASARAKMNIAANTITIGSSGST